MTDAPQKTPPNQVDTSQIDVLHTAAQHIKEEIRKTIYGQEEVINLALITLFAGGHGLLVGVPGLAKTLLVETLSTVMGLKGGRIQCTPDLMPADILGTEVLEEDQNKQKYFRFIKGPVFCQLLMADEINRASPRTQSALLQAMAEKTVTVAGQNHPLPIPFHVLATQNPLEQEGTYPLPEAQLDRFMLQINVDYPSKEEEAAMLLGTTTTQKAQPQQIFTPEALQNAQALVREVPIGQSVVEHVLTTIRRTRPLRKGEKDGRNISQHLLWGAGPRAGQALLLTAKAKAVIEGRFTPSIEDVNALLPAVLRHRISPTFSARAAGLTTEDLLQNLLEV